MRSSEMCSHALHYTIELIVLTITGESVIVFVRSARIGCH